MTFLYFFYRLFKVCFAVPWLSTGESLLRSAQVFGVGMDRAEMSRNEMMVLMGFSPPVGSVFSSGALSCFSGGASVACHCSSFTAKLKFFLGMAFQCSSHSTIFLGVKKSSSPSLVS